MVEAANFQQINEYKYLQKAHICLGNTYYIKRNRISIHKIHR